MINNKKKQTVLLDHQFNIIEVNRSFANDAGFNPDDLIGNNYFSLFSDSKKEILFKTVLDTGKQIRINDNLFANEQVNGINNNGGDWLLSPLIEKNGKASGLVLSRHEDSSSNQPIGKSKKQLLKLLLGIIGAIFVAEILIMWLLTYISGLSQGQRLLFDSIFLILFTFPVLYFWVFRPFLSNIIEKKQLQRSMTESKNFMEGILKDRTEKLEQLNLKLQGEIENRKKIENKITRSKNELEENIMLRTAQLSETNKKLLEEITERKNIEKKLEMERQRLFSVLEQIPASVHLVAEDYSIRFANRYFRERFGDPKNKPCYKILHNADQPCSDCKVESVLSTKSHGIFEETHSDNRLYRIYDYPFKDINGDDLVLQMGIDITDQKKAEKELQKNEKKFRSLVNSMNDTVFTLDSEDRITGVYGTFLKNIGLNPTDFSGKKISDIFSDHNAHIHQDALDRVKKGDPIMYEWEVTNYEGRLFFQSSLSPIYDKEGNINEILGVAREVTKQKNMERQLIRTEKLMAVGQMSAMISHEFRNSLTSLKMILELQMESEHLAKDERESLGVALSSVSYMENIIGQLVTFSRPGSLQVGPVEINQLVEESIHFVKIQVEKEHIRVVKDLGDDLPVINLDATRIREAVGNLLLNAVQAMFQNSADSDRILHVKTAFMVLEEKLWDQIHAAAQGAENGILSSGGTPEHFLASGTECIHIAVQDTGPGFERESIETIFDPFYTTKTSGTGLGLALVKRIVTEHGGIIQVESIIDKGTTFHLYLPVEHHGTN